MQSSTRILAQALVLPAVLCARAAAADWEYVPAPDGDFLSDVAILAPDDAWAVGRQDGPLLHPTVPQALRWDGASWSEVPTPMPGLRRARLEAVGIVSSDEVWVGGTQELATGFAGSVKVNLLVMRWDGADWEVMDTPLLGQNGAGAVVREITVLGPDDIWFGGDWTGRALAMHWDGSDFTLVDTPTFGDGGSGTFGNGHAIEAMSALSATDIWAVGGAADGDSADDESNIFHWDGASWEHVPGPTPGLYHRLYGVAAIAPDDVWAVGKNEPDGPFALHWDGASWTLDPLPGFSHPFGQLDTVTGRASDDLWAAGTYLLQEPPDVARPLLMHYDGGSWTQVPSDPDGPELGWFRGLDQLANGATWVVGALGNGGPHTQRHVPGAECADPIPYGVGKTTSLGSVPALSWTGAPSASGAGFAVDVTGGVPGQPGLAFWGSASASIPFLGGTLYVQPPLVRLPVHFLDGGGATSYPIAVDATMAGMTRYYQFWFRDPNHPDGTGIGLSSGLEVGFCR